MQAFAAATRTIFRDPNVSAAATYTPQGGSPLAIRVVRRAPDRELSFNDTQFVREAVTFQVQVADVAQPAAGDLLECDGELREVQGTPTRNEARLVWNLDTRPHAP